MTTGRAILLLALGACCALAGCTIPDPQGGEAYDDVVDGTISYPFVDETAPLGRDQPDQKLVIRSAVGDREYSIEIPGAARDYDVQVPLAALGDATAAVATAPMGAGPRGVKGVSPVATDKEMVGAFPRLDRDRPTDTALMDSAFGVGNADGPPQAPSYTLGLAKINDFYRKRQFEYALVEINNLLAFYPNSPKLNKMKGTVLLKMRNYRLAELAWIKALELDPGDKAVRAALDRLQKRMVAKGIAPADAMATGAAAAAPAGGAQAAGQALAPPAAALPIPKPIGTPPPVTEPALAH